MAIEKSAGAAEAARTTDLLEGTEHEVVQFVQDPGSGLRAVIAIHDSSLGPALGGTRCRDYPSIHDALVDALDLSRAMTRKAAIAGLPAGGAKIVMLAGSLEDRAAAYRALGTHVEAFGGRLFTSGDFGTSDKDLRTMAQTTRFVTHGPRDGTTDLSRATAEGVFFGASACLEVLGIDQWSGQSIAIQGLGKIGLHLATLAARAGAQVFASEVDTNKAGLALDALPVTLVSAEEIFDVPCDVLSPCAVGRVLDRRVVDRLRCKVVAGAANNPLQDDSCAVRLHERGILYAPDFVVSSGALLLGCGPALPGFKAPTTVAGIGDTVRDLALESLSRKVSPEFLARERADQRWRSAREARRT